MGGRAPFRREVLITLPILSDNDLRSDTLRDGEVGDVEVGEVNDGVLGLVAIMDCSAATVDAVPAEFAVATEGDRDLLDARLVAKADRTFLSPVAP